MNKKTIIHLGAAALLAGALAAPAGAASKKPAAKAKPAAKPAAKAAAKGKAAPAKGKDAKGGKKAADLPSTPHKWAAAFDVGYGWQNSDTNAGVTYGADLQLKIKKRQSVGLSVTYSQNDLEPRRVPNRSLDTLGIHLDWLIHTPEDNGNRQPGFYLGFGPSLIMGDLDTVGKETEFGWNARVGVEYKTGLYSEIRFIDTKPVQKFNNAKLGGTSISAGYRFSL